MSDILLRHIDEAMVERIKSLARERNKSLNEVLLQVLRQGLGMSAVHPFPERTIDPARAGAHLDDTEARVFDEVSCAILEVPDDQFAPKRDSSA